VVEEKEIRAEDLVRPLFDKPPRGRDFTAELAKLRADGYEERSVEGLNIARTSAVKLRVFYRR